MPFLNKAILLGTLTRAPAFWVTTRGAPLCAFDLQLTDSPRDPRGRQAAGHIRIIVWGRQAEACRQSLAGGSSVLIEGHLRLAPRPAREGPAPRQVEVVAERVCFVDGPGGIRAAIPREPPIDAPAPAFEVDPPTQVPEADPPAFEE
jgi:single-strand DNA-binding protein